MSAIKIDSSRVILVEGYADEFVPNAEPAVGMHGFAILVPPGGGGEQLLDMLWRITMAYAGMPSLLVNQANVRKMVEAVMSKEGRELQTERHPVRKGGLAELTIAKTESVPAPRGGRRAERRPRN